MCHYNFPRIVGLHNFPTLKSLCIVAQDISHITGLESCKLLESLWICETKVSKIEGLDELQNLKRLFLYSNCIKKIEGLSNLVSLEHLSLSDNEITEIENVENLYCLTVFHIGNNKIKTIGNSLNQCINLIELNLSGNLISSFREILHLASLKKLVQLCLSDPNYSDNPICALCNYQTYGVHHLPKLTSFDTLDVTAESRKIISATIVKKRMYYNMRIITIRRNCNFLLKTIVNVIEPIIQRSTLESEQFLAKSAKVQQHIDLLSVNKDSIKQKALVAKYEYIKNQLICVAEKKYKYVCDMNQHVNKLQNQITNQSNEAIRALLLELETGGNVRFEDEQKGAPWVLHCEKQIKKFIRRAASKDSPKTIQIHRISKLHNRGSKIKFEERATRQTGPDKGIYLCFQNNDGNADIFSIAEHGFDVKSKQGIMMTNYFDCQDLNSSNKLRKAIILRIGHCKTHEIGYEDVLEDINVDAFSGCDILYQRLDQSDGKAGTDQPKRCLVLNPDCLLAEYAVEYSLETDLDPNTTQLERLVIDIAYSNRLSHANMPTIVNELSSKIKPQSMALEHQVMNIEQMEKEYPELSALEDMTKSIKDYTKLVLTDKTPTDHLNLTGITPLNPEYFNNRNTLKTIIIRHSELTNVPLFLVCPLLETLDLSFNKITVIPDIALMMPKLKELNMISNSLNHISSISSLTKTRTSLERLDIRFNRISSIKELREYIVGRLKSLTVMNQKPITETERTDAERMYIQSQALISQNNSSEQSQSFRPMSIRTQYGPGSSSLEQNYYFQKQFISLSGVIDAQKITTLELDSCQLVNLDLLPDRMVKLRWASFRNNFIEDISKLANYLSLEELSLENNQISFIDCLSSLNQLAKLDVSNNIISTVENVPFKALMFLCLEKNQMKSLRAFSKIPTLLELYVGDNKITHSFTTFPLKELPRLIILDLTGNAVCKLPNFRLFTIFHLNRLKILNGAGITSKDQAQAKDMYMGKLTIELLGEKIGHFNFKNITELDLRNCKIREIDCLSGVEFRSLRKLNFDNNLLANIDCFTSLSSLKHLSLNNNRIERLLSIDGQNSNTTKVETETIKSFPKTFLSNLEELYLGYNTIARISDLGLHRMPQLKVLYLQGNKITKVDGLEQMTNLIELVIDKNQIKSIDPLSFLSLINLRELHIKENRLKSLANFDCLPNLQILFLTNNRIHEMSEIEKMKLPSILEISLASNAVCRKQLYRIGLVIRFPHIMGIDGKEVTNEERQRAHTFYLEQCLIREDPVAKLVSNASSQNLVGSSMNPKLAIKITSVVLDGLEMKLSSNSGFGIGRP
ncbi:hypothetical protein BC833DRAFT_598395 [Globomyces pollinis-pini]|nr:hypothetical protein BC833DRAFT_598395 [Globomyces pollinis-pini]